MRTDIRKKRKVEEVMKFAKKIKKIQEEVGKILRKEQKEMK